MAKYLVKLIKAHCSVCCKYYLFTYNRHRSRKCTEAKSNTAISSFLVTGPKYVIQTHILQTIRSHLMQSEKVRFCSTCLITKVTFDSTNFYKEERNQTPLHP